MGGKVALKGSNSSQKCAPSKIFVGQSRSNLEGREMVRVVFPDRNQTQFSEVNEVKKLDFLTEGR